ncbi:MAG: hypothetical protein IJ660_00640 [Alphaproteobacteria bacterium]|nr:hypothetical protein [Alphaproteobacteria bacterium]
MDKLSLIDALIKSEALSTEEIVKHWIETKRLNIEKLQRAYACIAINRANLEHIQFGMIWYTDDTVSRELRPDKMIKSVVLGVDLEFGIIYGDTFLEMLNTSKTEMELYLDDHPNVDLASEQKFARLTKESRKLNGILKQIGKPTWKGRTYWCAENTSENGAIKGHNLPLHTSLFIDEMERHDFHPIYECYVRY